MNKLITICLLSIWATVLNAQDLQITRFERDYTNLFASTNPEYDNAGEACAVIRFLVRDNDFDIEPNLGIVKREKIKGEIRLWVPRGTKRITVRRKQMMPLSGYEIPIQIESKVTYRADLSVTEAGLRRRKANKGHNVYAGIGLNATSILGPSVSIGVDINNHNVELGAVYGLKKTDGLYFYDTQGDVFTAYKYQPIRIQLRYGYDFRLTDFLSLVPQVGGAFNIINGSAVEGVAANTNYKSASSFSAFGALRLTAAFSDYFRLQITPEYDFGLSKNANCKMISNHDSTFKSWTDGFNLNIGLMIFF